MATHWGALKPILREKSATEKWVEWARAHQEIVAVTGIVLLLMGFGIPYIMHSREQSEKDAQEKMNLGQYYLHATVDPKNGTFKTEVEKNQQSLQTFQRIVSDYPGTKTAKLARFYLAKCEFSVGQYTQAYSSFDIATQELKNVPLGAEAYFGKILCLEAQNEFSQAANLAEVYLKTNPDSFLAPEMGLTLSDLYLKINDKSKALEELKSVAQTAGDSSWGKEAARRLQELQS